VLAFDDVIDCAGRERYGFMLPPGLFHPSHPSTLNIAGCLATNPPVRACRRETLPDCRDSAGT